MIFIHFYMTGGIFLYYGIDLYGSMMTIGIVIRDGKERK